MSTRRLFLGLLGSIGLGSALPRRAPARTAPAKRPLTTPIPDGILARVAGEGQCGTVLRVAPLQADLWPLDSFFIDGMEGTHPYSNNPRGVPVKFILTHRAMRGDTELRIYPPIIDSGNYKNMTARPADGAAIRVHLTGPVVSHTVLSVSPEGLTPKGFRNL